MSTMGRVLQAYRRAMLDLDADALAELYAVDGVHELPFLFPGMSHRLEGREAVRAAYRATWAVSDARPEEIRDVRVLEVEREQTLLVEQEVLGRMLSTAEPFRFPGVLVLSFAGGKISRVRDYMDGLAVAQASGRLDAVAAALRAS